jgi:nickel transport protein
MDKQSEEYGFCFFCRKSRTGFNLPFAILAFFLLASPTFAHGIRVSASVEGKTIHGRVTYQGGEPVKNCTVTGHDAADEVLAKTKTDDEGKFAFEARWRCDYHVEAETEDGHGGEYVVKAALLPRDLPSRESPAATDSRSAEHAHGHAADDASGENPWTAEQLRVVQAKLDALQEKLDASERSIRIRDVLGGIGYIFGLFGLYSVAVHYRKKSRV